MKPETHDRAARAYEVIAAELWPGQTWVAYRIDEQQTRPPADTPGEPTDTTEQGGTT